MVEIHHKLDQSWYLYLLHLDGKQFYTGITTNPERRYAEHLSKGNDET